MVQVGRELRAQRVALVAIDELDPEGLRTAAARAVRAHHGGGTVAWALDESLPLALVPPGAGGRRGRRPRRLRRGPLEERRAAAAAWSASSSAARPRSELREVAARAELVARWTNVARELVDGPPNVVTPASLAERAAALPGLRVEVLDPVAAGLPALAAVGGSSAAAPQLIVLRHEPAGAPERPRLALVGKAVTFDAGGYFLKPQSDIVRQKGDMAGGAAVLAALGAIAELELPLSVLGVIPACENMIGADAAPAVGRDHDRRRPHRRGDEPGRRGPADPRRRALVRARRRARRTSSTSRR